MQHPVSRRLRLLLALLFALLGATGCATHRASPLRMPDPALDRCEAPVTARLRFLERRLDAHARYARRWWWAWNGVFGGGLAFAAASAATEDGRGARANQAVDAVKSAIGLTQNLVDPPPAREGVEALRAIDPSRPGACAERLARAEDLLARAVHDARRRRTWRPHLVNLALNLAGALIVAEGFHEGTGYSSGALGIVVGEIEIWSRPWQAEATLEEYERRFPAE